MQLRLTKRLLRRGEGPWEEYALVLLVDGGKQIRLEDRLFSTWTKLFGGIGILTIEQLIGSE